MFSMAKRPQIHGIYIALSYNGIFFIGANDGLCKWPPPRHHSFQYSHGHTLNFRMVWGTHNFENLQT